MVSGGPLVEPPAQAFFVRDGTTYVPTGLSRGPWNPLNLHGGPPAALLGTMLERHEPRPDAQITRLTFEILRPIPLEPLSVETRTTRSGKSVQHLAGTLSTGGVEVLRATAVRIRTTDRLPLEGHSEEGPAPPGPETARPGAMLPIEGESYLTAMEGKFVRGNFDELGPATAWFRMRYPLILGEETLPLARVLIAADAGNGISGVLNFFEWIYINPDLTVHLNRLPAGEWVCLEAETTISARGIGLARSRIFDPRGPLGWGLQSLFVDRRR